MASMPNTLTHHLRLHTKHLHTRLDSTPLLRQLLHTSLTTDAYARSLSALHMAYRHLEAELARLEPLRPAGVAPYASRLPALTADLAALHGTVPDTAVVFSLKSHTNVREGLGHYLGMRYVVEGATQGAKPIFKRLHETLPSAHHAMRYWEQQHTLGHAWPAFCLCVNSHSVAQFGNEALMGAERAFEQFLAVFHDSSQQPADNLL